MRKEVSRIGRKRKAARLFGVRSATGSRNVLRMCFLQKVFSPTDIRLERIVPWIRGGPSHPGISSRMELVLHFPGTVNLRVAVRFRYPAVRLARRTSTRTDADPVPKMPVNGIIGTQWKKPPKRPLFSLHRKRYAQ